MCDDRFASTPLVSIIIPAYNPTEREIRRALKSCLEQTCEDLEVIIVDDGSRQEIARVIDNISCSCNRVAVHHIANSGVSHARNLGLSKARGEYITFLDADDELLPEFLEQAVGYASDYNLSVVFGTIVSRFEAIDRVSTIDVKSDSIRILCGDDIAILQDYLLSRLEPTERVVPSGVRRGAWAKLFARRILNGVEFDERLTYGEDCVFVVDALSRAESVGIVDHVWYVYYQNEGSLVHSLSFNDEFVNYASFLKDHFIEEPTLKNAVQGAITMHFFATLDNLYTQFRFLCLHDVRYALALKDVRDAFRELDFSKYKLSKHSRFRYWLCRHRCALALALWHRYIAFRNVGLMAIADR